MSPAKRPAARHADIWLVNLDPSAGSELSKSRPCAIVSPDVLNQRLNTVIVVPLTSFCRNWPHRPPVMFDGVPGDAATDQIRTIDKSRLGRRIGALSAAESRAIARAGGDVRPLTSPAFGNKKARRACSRRGSPCQDRFPARPQRTGNRLVTSATADAGRDAGRCVGR